MDTKEKIQEPIIQDPNTPKFNAVTGQPTDYGTSLGLKGNKDTTSNFNTVTTDQMGKSCWVKGS